MNDLQKVSRPATLSTRIKKTAILARKLPSGIISVLKGAARRPKAWVGLGTVSAVSLWPIDPSLAVGAAGVFTTIWAVVATQAESVQPRIAQPRAEVQAVLKGRRNVDGLHLQLEIHNLGESAALDVRATAWLPDADGVMWYPVDIADGPHISPGGHISAPRTMDSLNLATQEDLSPYVLLEVSYQDGLPQRQEKTFAFDWVDGRDQYSPSFVLADWPGWDEVKRRRDEKLAEIQTAAAQAVESRPEVSIVLEDSTETAAHLSCRWEGRGKSDLILALSYPLHDFGSWAESLIHEVDPPTSPAPQQPAEPPDSDPPEDSPPEQNEA